MSAPDKISEGHTNPAAVVLSVIASAGFLLTPLLVKAVTEDLGFSDRMVGELAAAVMGGSTLSAVAATFWVRRAPWRLAAVLALSGLFAMTVASLLWRSFWPFLAAQFLSGFFGGSLYSLALTVLGETAKPDRGFGYSVAAQVAFQVIGLLLGPTLLGAGGIDALLGSFAVLAVVGLPLARSLPPCGRKREPGHGATTALFTLPVTLALAGCFLFFFNVNCYWTYVEPIGVAAGLPAQVIATDLAIGVAVGILGALLASWWGERYGRLGPIGASALMIVAAVVILAATGRSWPYLASAALYNFAWNLSLSYQYAAVHAADTTGRGIAITPAFHGAGAAVGPAVAAIWVSASDYRVVYWLSSVTVVLSLLAFAASVASRRRAAIAAA